MKRDINKAAALLVLACAPAAADSAVRARFLMGTVCEITAYGPVARPAVVAAFDEIARLDRMLSTFKDDSELSGINSKARVKATPASIELYRVLRISGEVHHDSGGAFDPTFRRNAPAIGFQHVKVTREPVTVAFDRDDVRVDLGGIGKGFALDAAAEVLAKASTTGALLNFGGQVLAVGTPPGLPYWDVPIDGTDLALHLKDASASTSNQGQKPGHILDPRTGKPVARKGSVTVIAKDATRADAWSTALFVLGVANTPASFKGCALEFDEKGRRVAMRGDCYPHVPGVPKPEPKKRKPSR